MKIFLNNVLYFSICAAFLVNAAFLAAELAGWVKSGNWKKNLGLALLFAAAFAASQVFCRGISPRGGYDNEHDFNYLAVSFFQRSDRHVMFGKEISPLVTDALSDAASGFSLEAILVKNRSLMFLSGVLLFACLLKLGLGLSAAFFGFALFCFNFLAFLNGNTFSTTAPNVFFLFSSLFAAAAFEKDRRDLKGLLWALAALFLVWTGRYELAFLPGLILAVSLLRPGGALRELALRPGARARTWLLLCPAVLLFTGWALMLIRGGDYNGPLFSEAARLFRNLQYQLGEKNLGVFFPQAAGLAQYLAVGALVLIFFRARFSGRDRLVLGAVLLLWTVYAAAIFIPLDRYPLHFMRHQLYFFIPFVFVFAAAWEALWDRPRGRALTAGLKWAALACFCALYLGANVKAVRSLEGEKRTNDLEWALLLKASKNWPKDCSVVYPVRDSRYFLLRKYFPFYEDRGRRGNRYSGSRLWADPLEGVPPSSGCFIKYLPPTYQIFSDADPGFSQDYNPASPSYAGPGDAPLYESAFRHRFYTIFADSESRREIPVRLGFYRADNVKDKAWILDSEGLSLFRGGGLAAAELKFRGALALDPGCGVCRVNLAACLAFGGKKREASALILKIAASGGAAMPLLAALTDVTAGEDAAALAGLEAFTAKHSIEQYLMMGFAYKFALQDRMRGPREKGSRPGGPP